MNLNFGGLIGAVILGGLAGLYVYSTDPDFVKPRRYRLVIGGAVVGGAIGNFAWGALFQKKQPQEPAQLPPEQQDAE